MENEIIKETNYEIPVRKRSSLLFIFLSIVLNVFYFTYWLFITVKDVNALENENDNEEDELNFWLYFFVILIVAILGGIFEKTIIELIMYAVGFIINYLISNAILSKVEKYAKLKYNVEFSYNRVAMFFLNFIYVNYAINDFDYRVEIAKKLNNVI